MKRKESHHFSTSGDTKSSVIEPFNLTLKQGMYRYFPSKNTLNFVPVLQDLVEGYNLLYHRSIKMAPNQVNQVNRSSVWKTLYGDKKRQFTTSETATESRRSGQFKKSYLPG